MKRTLLFVSLLISGASFAQFTQANEPANGVQAMHLLDETASDFSATTGTGVTWDYSTVAGVPSGARNLEVMDASASPEALSYTIASKAVVIDGFVTSYYSSSAASRNSKGFSFEAGAPAGTVKVVLNDDDEILMNYPFAQGGNVADAFAGDVVTDLGTFACTGSSTATVDGTGTLKLNAATTLTNVVRYKLTDNATATIPFPGIGNVVMNRVQYEYYDLANNTRPVFVYATLTMTIGTSQPTTQKVILNSVQPDGYLGIDANELSNITVYPNPATDVIAVKGLTANGTLTLVDAQGKTVASAAAAPGLATLSVATVDAGIYFLHVASEGASTVERVVIR